MLAILISLDKQYMGLTGKRVGLRRGKRFLRLLQVDLEKNNGCGLLEARPSPLTNNFRKKSEEPI